MDGGTEILNVKTIFDTLNARVALFAVGEILEMTNAGFPYADETDYRLDDTTKTKFYL